jgi:hypothetical protein
MIATNAGDDDRIVFDYPAFFASDFGKCVAEHFSMFQRNVGDHADISVNYVGRIEAPAQADLDDDPLDAFLRE